LSIDELDAEIQDKSDSDIVTKSLAVAQTAFLVIQSVARYSVGLRISELELITLGFIFCALVMTGFWWDKPFDVQSRYVVSRPAGDHIFQGGSSKRVDNFETWIGDYIFPEPIHLKDGAMLFGTAVFYFTGGGFAAIHMCAWNWIFPSRLIQTLWRTFSLAAMILTWLPLLIVPLHRLLAWMMPDTEKSRKVENNIMSVVIFAMLVIYAISRIGLLVLSFYCLSSMPETVYTRLDWIGFLPHLS